MSAPRISRFSPPATARAVATASARSQVRNVTPCSGSSGGWWVRTNTGPVVVGVLLRHPLGDLVGAPAHEHGAGGVHDLGKRELLLVLDDPVHRVAGAGDEAVQRHRPVHNDLARASIRIAHANDDPAHVTNSSVAAEQSPDCLGTAAPIAGCTCSGAIPGMRICPHSGAIDGDVPVTMWAIRLISSWVSGFGARS